MGYHDDYGSNTEADAARDFFAVHGSRRNPEPPADPLGWDRETNGTAHPALTEQPFTEEEA